MVGRVARAFLPVDIGQPGVEGALLVAVAAGWACVRDVVQVKGLVMKPAALP